MPTSMALFQRNTTAADRSQVLAANGAVIVVAVPAGTMLGGPLVSALGARGTLMFCAVAIITFGLLAAGFTLTRRPAPGIDG